MFLAAMILLTTLNATYAHCSFGLRYLFANLERWREKARILEFTIAQNPRDIAEAILTCRPQLVGFGVYIWNSRQTEEVVCILKKVQPDLLIVIGGPEVSHENEAQSLCALADYTMVGEADLLFRDFCENYFGAGKLPEGKFIRGPLPEIKKIRSPYPYYTDEDIKNRVIYVEASRGCPYKCEFCLSSLDNAVRNFHLPAFLADMDHLISRGARQLKFVDRTFNLNIQTSRKILEFFLERMNLGLFLHFELVPDRLPVELKSLIEKFPKGSLQFEIGVQTFNPEVSALISRRQDYAKVHENFHFLREKTHVHVHADLIIGLPGETLQSFAEGFNTLVDLGPEEIQLGLLKRLKGTPISRHDKEWEMVYQDTPPFTILSTRTLPYECVQQLGRFSKFWDLYANSGNFPHTLELLKTLSLTRDPRSFFDEFMALCRFLETRHPQTHSIALVNLVQSAWIYLTEKRGVDRSLARQTLIRDYCGYVRRDVPPFLREENGPARTEEKIRRDLPGWVRAVPPRQRRHVDHHSEEL